MDKENRVIFEIQKRYVWMRLNQDLAEDAMRRVISERRYKGSLATLTSLPSKVAKLNKAVNRELDDLAMETGWEQVWYKFFAGFDGFERMVDAMRGDAPWNDSAST